MYLPWIRKFIEPVEIDNPFYLSQLITKIGLFEYFSVQVNSYGYALSQGFCSSSYQKVEGSAMNWLPISK